MPDTSAAGPERAFFQLTTNWWKTIAAVVAAVTAPIGVIAASPRKFLVALEFALFEVRTMWFFYVGMLVLLTIAFASISLVVVFRGRPVRWPRTRGHLKFLIANRGIGPLVVLVAFGALVVAYGTLFEPVRYRLFSETVYQRLALRQADVGRITEAGATCSDYLELFPQRRSGHRTADAVCATLDGDLDADRAIWRYIQQIKPVVANDSSIVLPVAWDARRSALTLLLFAADSTRALPTNRN
jgi:hypothetical protein